MKLKDIYELAIEMGIKNGPRSKKAIKIQLERIKKEYEKLDLKKKEFFDKERLTNPFDDTRILYGEPNREIKKILVGIDAESPELLLANELNKSAKKKFDMVLTHHPEGRGLMGIIGVLDIQVDLFEKYGIPVNISEKLVDESVAHLGRRLSPINHFRTIEVAKMLDMAYACFHTVADNQVYTFLERLVEKKKPYTVGELLDALLEVPEYHESAKRGDMPKILVGSERSRAGKIAPAGITGGTNLGEKIYEKMAAAGIGTIIVMHLPDDNRKAAEKYHLNVIVAGHMASDSLGLNHILDKIERKGVEIVPCSGLIRVKR